MQGSFLYDSASSIRQRMNDYKSRGIDLIDDALDSTDFQPGNHAVKNVHPIAGHATPAIVHRDAPAQNAHDGLPYFVALVRHYDYRVIFLDAVDQEIDGFRG